MKDRIALLTFVLGIGVGAALAALILLRARGPGADELPPPEVRPPPVDVVKKERRQDHWQTSGYVEMVPPVRLPTTMSPDGDIKVWLKLPDGAVVTAKQTPDGPKIDFPPGTQADRVESYGDFVSDVRGTDLVDNGERFHVYVPKQPSKDAMLTGWEWPRDDEASHAVATEQLLAFLRVAPLPSRAVDPGRQRQQRLWSYRRNNDCARCHFADKPESHEAEDVIHRRTDLDGFYVPLTVLFDEGVIERHRPSDPNVDDRFVSVRCEHGEARVEEKDGRKRYQCPDGDAVLARYDVKAALAANDARAQGLCRSRRYLFDHMDANARALFAPAFEVCGIR